MTTTTLDTAVLKAALLRLANEEPEFLEALLLTLPQKNGKGLNGSNTSSAMEKEQSKSNYATEDGVNPLLHQIVAEDFAEYETVFKKLA